MMASIYLDNNATTKTDARVIDAIAACLREGHANPASQHQPGQRARKILEDARERMAQLLGAVPTSNASYQVVLTSGGTEANNLVLRGIAENRGGNIIISSIEHPSIAETAKYLESRGTEIRLLDVTSTGVARLDRLEALIDGQTLLVSVMLANNETGVLQPVQQIASICRSRGVYCHTDAVQAIGKVAVNFTELGVDAMTIAPHKFHGPLGIGLLLLRLPRTPAPLLFGGFQQLGIRPGTESVALAVGAATSLKICLSDLEPRASHMQRLRLCLEEQLQQQLSNIVVHGDAVPRVPQTSSISFLGVDRQSLLLALDMAGLACSTGSACASGSSEPSPTLLAMGRPEGEITSALRFSLSAFTTEDEIVQAASRIAKCVNDLRSYRESRKDAAAPRMWRPKTL